MTKIRKTIIYNGNRTSTALEPEFWAALQGAASMRHMNISALISKIGGGRPGNLASMLRVWCLQQAAK